MSRSSRSIKKDIGLLIIRVAIGGSMLLFHGLPKLMRGPEGWEQTGSVMSNLGVDFLHSFWGFAATFTETIGAILIIIGLFTRYTSLFLAFTMLIAIVSHLAKGDGWSGASHALELMMVFVALYFTGAGRYSADKK